MHQILSYEKWDSYENQQMNHKQQATFGNTEFLLDIIGELRIFNVHMRENYNKFQLIKLSDGNDNENDLFFLREVYIDEKEQGFIIRFQYQLLFEETYSVTKGKRENLVFASYLIQLQKQNPQIYLQQDDDMVLAIFQYQMCPRNVLNNLTTNEINSIVEEVKQLLNKREAQLKQIHEVIQQKLNIQWNDIEVPLKSMWDEINHDMNYQIEQQGDLAKGRLIDIAAYNQQENRISFVFRGQSWGLYRCQYNCEALYNVIDEQQLQNKYAAIIIEEMGKLSHQFENGIIYDIMRISEWRFSFRTKLNFIRSVCQTLNTMNLEQLGNDLQVQHIWSFYRKDKLCPVFILIEKTQQQQLSTIALLKNLIVEAIFDNQMLLTFNLMDDLFGDYMRYLVQVDESHFPKFSSIVKKIDCIQEILDEVYLLNY